MSGSISSNQSDLTYAVPTGLAAVMLAGVVTVLWRMTAASVPAMPVQQAMAPETAAPTVAMVAPARPAHSVYRIAAATPRTPVAFRIAPAPAAAAVPAPASAVAPAAPIAAPSPRVQPAPSPAKLARIVTPAATAPALQIVARAPAPVAAPQAAPQIGAKPLPIVRPAPAPTVTTRLAASTAPVQRVVVRKGETLWQIAAAHYGNGAAYQAIFQANRASLTSAALIRPGQVLVLPVLSAQGASSQGASLAGGSTTHLAAGHNRPAYRTGST